MMRLDLTKRFVSVCLVGAAAFGCAAPPCPSAAAAEEPAEVGRRSALVKLVELCSPSAVDIKDARPNPGGWFDISVGGGAIIHESGYILTNNHVVLGTQTAVRLHDGRQLRPQVVLRMPNYDVVLVKINAGRPLKPLKIGRSHNLVLGQRVVTFGNPAGLEHTVSPGIVSGLNRTSSASGPTISGMIQTNAPINGGNSGGPLINADGELIGVIEAKSPGAQNIGFAVPVDQVRKALPETLAAEQRYGFRLGLAVETLGPAKVTEVAAGSPAAKAGVRVGDVISRVGGFAVTDGLHYHLGLIGRKPGQVLPLTVARGGKTLTLSATLKGRPIRSADKVEGLVNGLNFAAYRGDWTKLPDFDKLEPADAGQTTKFAHTASSKVSGERYGLKFTGYIHVPADGNYTFYIASDDGSQVFIGDELVVDHDGLHGATEKNAFIRLKAGKHPITVLFFQRTGGIGLRVSYEGPGVGKQEIPPAALFIKP